MKGEGRSQKQNVRLRCAEQYKDIKGNLLHRGIVLLCECLTFVGCVLL